VTLLSNILTAEDIDAADRVATLMERSGLSCLEAEFGGLTIRVTRAAAAAPGDDAASAGTGAEIGADVIAAPQVGLFRAAGLRVGSGVAAGAVIGRIDVLGDLHDVVAAQAGTVCALCAADGGFVEYGQPLLTIRPLVAAG
jgi:biotin carboxyl carrier protein